MAAFSADGAQMLLNKGDLCYVNETDPENSWASLTGVLFDQGMGLKTQKDGTYFIVSKKQGEEAYTLIVAPSMISFNDRGDGILIYLKRYGSGVGITYISVADLKLANASKAVKHDDRTYLKTLKITHSNFVSFGGEVKNQQGFPVLSLLEKYMAKSPHFRGLKVKTVKDLVGYRAKPVSVKFATVMDNTLIRVWRDGHGDHSKEDTEGAKAACDEAKKPLEEMKLDLVSLAPIYQVDISNRFIGIDNFEDDTIEGLKIRFKCVASPALACLPLHACIPALAHLHTCPCTPCTSGISPGI